MALRVYNTLTRQKEAFQTVQPGRVGMYVCGPTVYKPSHVGHMVGPVIFDTVKRFLTYLGYKVTFVVNITDVDDKLIVRAREMGTTVKDLAERMTADYRNCLAKLNVTGIDHMPKATENIGEMLTMIGRLIEKGYAYAAGGDVYFDISKDEDYGKLCNRDPEQLEAGVRIEVSEKKRNPGDFALWKGAKPGEPQWDSPWGPGRPGWHIECSAMSMRLLGQTLDIHGGGLDLQFPHHENELAQSESYSGKPFARYWMHNGLMRMGHAKMAGSVGNVINVIDLLQKHAPETVRFLLLGTHYRSPIEYSEERLQEVRRSLDGFYRFFERYQRITGKSFFELRAATTLAESSSKDLGEASLWFESWKTFIEHMEDDFNTGGAAGVLYELLNRLNRFADERKLEAGATEQDCAGFTRGALVLRELSQILGLFREPPSSGTEDPQLLASLVGLTAEVRARLPEVPVGAANPGSVKEAVEALIAARAAARKAKQFAVGDEIRKRLKELNVTLEDRPGGKTDWRIGS
jgi:cysteinyl-tRNA synthetase